MWYIIFLWGIIGMFVDFAICMPDTFKECKEIYPNSSRRYLLYFLLGPVSFFITTCVSVLKQGPKLSKWFKKDKNIWE